METAIIIWSGGSGLIGDSTSKQYLPPAVIIFKMVFNVNIELTIMVVYTL